MKKVVLAVALLIGVVSLSKAQGGGGGQGRNMGTPEERAARSISRLPETLKLTDDQKTKLTAVYVAQSKSQDSLRTAMGQGGDRQAMMTKFQEMTASTDKSVMALLTDDQKKVYEEYTKTRQQFGRGGQGGGQRPAQNNN
jgi:hypothetical protein